MKGEEMNERFEIQKSKANIAQFFLTEKAKSSRKHHQKVSQMNEWTYRWKYILP